MSQRKRFRVEKYDYPYKCPACFAPMLLTFRRPKAGENSLVFKTCIAPDEKLVDQGCGSKFRFTIKKSIILDPNGKELPYTITRKVVELTEKGAKVYQMKMTHKLADKMSGGVY